MVSDQSLPWFVYNASRNAADVNSYKSWSAMNIADMKLRSRINGALAKQHRSWADRTTRSKTRRLSWSMCFSGQRMEGRTGFQIQATPRRSPNLVRCHPELLGLIRRALQACDQCPM